MTNTKNSNELKEQLKKRLFGMIGAQIEQVAFVPEELPRLMGDVDLDSLKLPDHPQENMEQTDAPPLNERINSLYDFLLDQPEYIAPNPDERTDYWNYGYWDDTTTSFNAACERLQNALLDWVPDKSGRILDVGCGKGASTRHLLNYYAPENVWAINISEKQIEETRKNAPGCNAQVMDATDLKFENDFFNNIISIEAALHFETRRKFFDESFRVLKQEGNLVLSDVLFSSKERLEQNPQLPSAENHLETVEEYEKALMDAGFRNVIVKDVTDEVWGAHFLYVLNRSHEAFYKGLVDIIKLTDILWIYYHLNAITKLCILARGQKLRIRGSLRL